MEQDCLIRGVHSGLGLRAVWAETAGTVNAGITLHDTDPAAAAAFADALGAAAASAAMLDEKEKFSIRYDYPGTLRGFLIEAAADGALRGLPFSPHPLQHGPGEVTVLYGDGDGQVAVTRSNANGKILNSGQTRAPLADPAGDLAFYFCVSDQIETEIRTWVDWRPEPQSPAARMSVLLLQALPGCDLEIFSRLRNALHSAGATRCRKALDPAMLPEMCLSTMLRELADAANVQDFDPNDCVWTAGATPHWHCHCTREGMRNAMTVLGQQDLEKLFQEHRDSELECQFCRKHYSFRREDFPANAERA